MKKFVNHCKEIAMCYPPKAKSPVSTTLIILLALNLSLPALAAELRTPEGVRLLKKV